VIRDLDIKYWNASGVTFTWLGAMFGPLFLRIGFGERIWTHSLIGFGALILVAMSMRSGAQGLRRGAPPSDIVVSLWIPGLLLVVGVVMALVLRR